MAKRAATTGMDSYGGPGFSEGDPSDIGSRPKTHGTISVNLRGTKTSMGFAPKETLQEVP